MGILITIREKSPFCIIKRSAYIFMKNSENEKTIDRSQQIERKIRIITYISLLTFSAYMIVSGFHTVFQSWEQARLPNVTSTYDRMEN
ncbi:MAG: hypothetical protein EAZ76_08410 [Nostocales cyanobacterium]|nr:MAG: hypothetical protein EAZ76_08410 [Nostocales cyanobacterium]